MNPLATDFIVVWYLWRSKYVFATA